MKTMKCPKCKGHGGYPKCGTCQNKLVVNDEADDRLALTPCSPSLPDGVQILIYDKRLTHSYWCDFQHRCRTWNGLMNTLRHEIKRGRCTAYRFITVHQTNYGLPPENDKVHPTT